MIDQNKLLAALNNAASFADVYETVIQIGLSLFPDDPELHFQAGKSEAAREVIAALRQGILSGKFD